MYRIISKVCKMTSLEKNDRIVQLENDVNKGDDDISDVKSEVNDSKIQV